MSKWKYRWEIEYYTTGCLLNRQVFDARDREDALEQLHQTGIRIIAIKCCRRIDRY